jgi:hypothetical protein
MSVNIVLPPLKTWAEQHLSSIIKATTKPAFDSAFEAFLSKQAKITVNGKSVSRDDYRKQLEDEGFDEAGAAVHFTGAVEVPSESNDIQVSTNHHQEKITLMNSRFSPGSWTSSTPL